MADQYLLLNLSDTFLWQILSYGMSINTIGKLYKYYSNEKTS